MSQTGAIVGDHAKAARRAGARPGRVSLACLCLVAGVTAGPGLLTGLALAATPLQAQIQGQAQSQSQVKGQLKVQGQAKDQHPVSADRARQLQQQRELWEALPEADRKAVQDSLVWLGFYNGVTDGAFGQRTADAIAAFEKRELLEPGAVIAGPGLAVLRAEANKQKSAVGFTLTDDAATGARIGVPSRLFDRKDSAPGRTRLWSSRTPASLTLFAGGTEDGDLPAWFARATGPAPGRKITYKLLRPDFAVVTGDEGPRRFFTRVAAGPEGLRGFTFVYPLTDAVTMDRVTIGIANSFAPFAGKPGAIPPAVLSPGTVSPGGQPSAPQAADAPVARQAGGAPLTGGALLLGSGRAITATAAVRGCKDIRLGEAAATVTASDRQSGLSLLSAAGAAPANAGPIILAKADAAQPANDLAQPASDLVLAGWSPDAAGKPQLSVIPGQLAKTAQAGSVNAALQPGGAGALALDGAGALIGMVSSLTAAPAVAGVTLAADHPLASADSIRRLLADVGVTPQAAAPGGAGPAPGSGAVVARWRARLAPVSCLGR